MGPVSLHRAAGDPKRLGDLRHLQADEAPEFDDLRLSRVDTAQRIERLIEVEKKLRGQLRRDVELAGILVEGHTVDPPSALAALASPGVIDQYLAHGASSHAEEVAATRPVRPELACELEVGLVDDLGGLERVGPSLPPQMSPREDPQLLVHEWKNPVRCLFRRKIFSQPAKKLRHLGLRRLGHSDAPCEETIDTDGCYGRRVGKASPVNAMVAGSRSVRRTRE